MTTDNPIYVTVVDKEDNPIGLAEKLEAHQKGLLHRAVSIIIVNSKGEILLQKRSTQKYHSAGLWSNTCCTHPYPGESVEDAAIRRLYEEMGISIDDLKLIDKIIYYVELENNLKEHELDYVFIAQSDSPPRINPLEVEDYKYVPYETLKQDINQNPEKYTYWFRIIMQSLNLQQLKNLNN
ncbi:MAG: isopentenyl-diphosphate Delta-isomerase [Bacteroidia bacterium]